MAVNFLSHELLFKIFTPSPSDAWKAVISKSDFLKLKHGDVLLWKHGSSVIYRTVIDGPADSGGGSRVYFAIRRRSWTGRAKTCYGWNDIKHRITLVKKTTLVMLKEECEHLKDIGFNARKELVRELKEARATKLRMGRELCQRNWRMPV